MNHQRLQASFFSTYHRWQIESGEPLKESICAELAQRLPHIDPWSWPERFELGGVYLAGRRASCATAIQPPCRLEYYEPTVPLEKVGELYSRFSSECVLYADDDLAVVVKPSRLPTMPARDQVRYNLWSFLNEHFGKVVHLPSRLDTGVQGVLLCSLSARMNRYFQKAFERRWIGKYYVAEVPGSVAWERLLMEDRIARDPRHPVLRRCVQDHELGETAVTRMTRLGSYEANGSERTLIQANPLTGRTHQIRLHCQAQGHSIVGDPYYGGIESDELRLVSYALRFHHPYRREVVTFELPQTWQPAWLKNAAHALQGIQVLYD